MTEAIRIEPVPPRAIAGIESFRNRAATENALAGALGLRPPEGSGFVREGQRFLFRLAPARFCAMAPDGDNLARRLGSALAGLAAVTDQSDSWAIFFLSGAALHDYLAKIVPIDLRPLKFTTGSLALTRAAHVDVRLWKLNDSEAEIAVTRSLERDFLQTLRVAARAL